MSSLSPPPPHQDSPSGPVLAVWNGQVSRWMNGWTATNLGLLCPVTSSNVSPVLLTRRKGQWHRPGPQEGEDPSPCCSEGRHSGQEPEAEHVESCRQSDQQVSCHEGPWAVQVRTWSRGWGDLRKARALWGVLDALQWEYWAGGWKRVGVRAGGGSCPITVLVEHTLGLPPHHLAPGKWPAISFLAAPPEPERRQSSPILMSVFVSPLCLQEEGTAVHSPCYTELPETL